jgi:hypothetical protein
MEWLGWSLFFISLAMLVVESWVGRWWFRIAMEWQLTARRYKAQNDALAAELAVWKRTRGKS